MPYDPAKHHRRSIRLRGYDYRQAGAYYVTIVTQGRVGVYGEIANGEMLLNAAGQMIEKWWLELMSKFSRVEIDEYVVMPNHFHGILVIVDGADAGSDPGARAEVPRPHEVKADDKDSVGAAPRVGPGLGGPEPGAHARAPLLTVIQWFKTMTTNEYIRGVKTMGWPTFDRKLWQRNYFERVIRDEDELRSTRLYIQNNPAQWALDRENPNLVDT